MKRKTISQVLRDADRDLTVISGGAHRRGRKRKAIKLDEVSHIELPAYTPHRLTEEDWKKAGGLKCPRCGQDTVKLVPIGLTGKIKMCPDCIERRRRLFEHKRRLIDLRRGAELVARARLGIIS